MVGELQRSLSSKVFLQTEIIFSVTKAQRMQPHMKCLLVLFDIRRPVVRKAQYKVCVLNSNVAHMTECLMPPYGELLD